MGRIAFVFSGQGAQCAGMGRSFYESSDAVRELFDEAEKIRPGTLEMCFSGSAQDLQRTENTQPCLYLSDLAAALAMNERGIEAGAAAGFSLGEIPALAFAKSFTYADGFRIASVRGVEMGKSEPASMAAVLKLDDETVISVVSGIDGVWAVNFNSPGQVVISCRDGKFEEAAEKLKAAGGRIIPLKVGGGFHSPLMDGASHTFAAALLDFDVAMPQIPVYADRTAQIYADSPMRELPLQITSPVRWSKLIENMTADGFDTFVECGVGSTLKGLISRIVPQARVFSVTDRESADAAAKEILS